METTWKYPENNFFSFTFKQQEFPMKNYLQ